MLLADPVVARAVTNIRIRADDQPDPTKLSDVFVDTGVLQQLDNANDQIIHGRRGTGKTHVFTYQASRLARHEAICPVLIDVRTLGSSPQFTDPKASIHDRCLALFRDILFAVRNGILRHIGEHGNLHSDVAIEGLEALDTAFAEPVTEFLPTSYTNVSRSEGGKSREVSAEFDNRPKITAKLGSTGSNSREVTQEYQAVQHDKVHFPMIGQSLRSVLDAAGLQLVIFLDEWSSLPPELQPYLAEFLKRSIMPLPIAVLKIAALEHRSVFLKFEGNEQIGFELGADIAAARHLDDFYTFEMNPEGLVATFADVLLHHLRSELPDGYLESRHHITTPSGLVDALFESGSVFAELVHASEGNLRDFIQVFADAFQRSGPRRTQGIGLEATRKAAVDYTYLHKLPNVPSDLRFVMQHIVRVLVSEAKRRDFYLGAESQSRPVIQRLLDSRLLHVTRRVVVSAERPGEVFSQYVFDYGFMLPFFSFTKSLGHERLSGADPDEHDAKIQRLVDDGEIAQTGV